MKIINSIISLVLTIFILFGSSFFVVYNDGFYLQECKKLNTDCKRTIEVLKYLENKNDLGKDFTSREVRHMKDVKSLIMYLKIFYFGLMAVLILLISIVVLRSRNYSDIYINLIYTGVFSLAFMLLMGLISWIKFDFVFSLFHSVFFKSGTWLFNGNDLIIRLFPLQFFIDSLRLIVLISTGVSTLLICLGFGMKRFK